MTGDLEGTLTGGGEVVFANSCRALTTVEAARKSTGLGFSIARALAKRMDGTLTAEYMEGKLVLTVRFP